MSSKQACGLCYNVDSKPLLFRKVLQVFRNVTIRGLASSLLNFIITYDSKGNHVTYILKATSKLLSTSSLGKNRKSCHLKKTCDIRVASDTPQCCPQQQRSRGAVHQALTTRIAAGGARLTISAASIKLLPALQLHNAQTIQLEALDNRSTFKSY